MNFRRRQSEAPEINLIPFIDVLLVVLIFLMLSTTYSRYSELQITLPTADADKLAERPAEILVSVAADGRYAINRTPLDGRSIELLTAALTKAADAEQVRLDKIRAAIAAFNARSSLQPKVQRSDSLARCSSALATSFSIR